MRFWVAGAMDCASCQKWAKRVGFAALAETMAGVKCLKRMCKDDQRCISHGRRSTRDVLIREVGGSRRWFLETGCIFANQIFRFAKMILHFARQVQHFAWHGFTSSSSSWHAQYFTQMEPRKRKTHCYGVVRSAVSYSFLKDFSHNCSSKIKEASQKFVALRLEHCEHQFLRKSRGIASLWTCQPPLSKVVWQNCFVSDRKTAGKKKN